MDTDTTDSGASDVFVGKEPCSACGSRDNLARYADGHGFCFGCAHREPADKAYSPPTDYTPQAKLGFRPSQFQISAIPKRNLSEQTCRFWSYGVGDYHSKTGLKPAQFANYRDPVTKDLVAQKLRFAGKEFAVLKEKGAQIPLFGAHLWPNDRRSLIITEGEIDAMSVSQAQNHKFPVVSLPNGAQSAAKSIKDNYEWVCEFDKIVLMFDDDEPGREAMETVAQLLPVGKAHIATLDGYKDANEALVDNKPGAIISAFWGAKVYQPDGIFTLTDIREEILSPVEMGRPWFLPTLTDLTYGRRKGETYYFGAGTGVGKTSVFTQQIEYDVMVLGIKTACIYLEQPPSETGKRIAGVHARKQFHIPDNGWSQGELVEALDALEATGLLYLGGNFASASWEQIKSRIRYMAISLGVEHIYLDHLTALADPSNERESLEIITKEIALLAQELGLVFHIISHLATPDGKPHEEGGRVMLRHFKGSRSIGFWAHFAFGLERNPQDEDAMIAQRTALRCLKDRYTGRANGKIVMLGYDTAAGIISECGDFPEEAGGFGDLNI